MSLDVQISDPLAIAKKAGLSERAIALVKPGMGNAEFMTVLQSEQLNTEAVPFLAHAIPEEKAVDWACQSCRTAGAMSSPFASAELAALEAAEATVPRSATAFASTPPATAAANVQANSPAFWAAQAADWAMRSGTPGLAPTSQGLVPHATAGAVQLSAVKAAPEGKIPDIAEKPDARELLAMNQELLEQTPAGQPVGDELVPTLEGAEQSAKAHEALQPFVELGRSIAET